MSAHYYHQNDNQTAFLTLQELAQKAVDKAAIQLKKACDHYYSVEHQLNELNDYYQEYQQRLNHALLSGMGGGQLANFQSFIITLEQSITQQKQRLIMLSIQQKQATQHLYQCQKKLNGYTTLLEKKQQIRLQQQNRIQQKMTDEFAQQQSIRRALYES